jgi:predicted deacylase
MRPEDFHPGEFPRDQKHALDLELDSIASGLKLPVLLVRGRNPGKTLVVTAAVHGDEYEGVRAVLDTFQSLNPSEMKGDFLSVPVANPPAFWAGTRTSPLDGGNLARLFPGSIGSGPTATIAHCIARSLIAHADFFLDLHSGGVKFAMPTMVGYDATDPRSHAAALIFGTSVVWAHPDISPGRTISFAKSQGIPWLYTEMPGGGRIDEDDLFVLRSGIRRLLRHLKILPGPPGITPVTFHLGGEADIDRSTLSSTRGFLIARVKLLQEVESGEELGRSVDLYGNTLEIFRASNGGVVGLVREWPIVDVGDVVFLVTELFR